LLSLLSGHAPPRDLHSFPTRRSSDLRGIVKLEFICVRTPRSWAYFNKGSTYCSTDFFENIGSPPVILSARKCLTSSSLFNKRSIGKASGSLFCKVYPTAQCSQRMLQRYVVVNSIFDNVNCPCSSTDRKSTRLNSSHVKISYAVFCL